MKINRKWTIFLCILATSLFCLGATSCGNILNIYCDEHKFKEKRIEATCTLPGKITRACEICEFKEEEEIPALGHDLRFKSGMPATCESAGYTSYQQCRRCDDIFGKEKIEPLGHDVQLTHSDSTKANCKERAYCGVCRKEYGDVDKSHTYQKVIVPKKEYCVGVGWTEYEYCAYEGCTYTTYQELAPVGHDGRREGQTEFISNISRITSCVETAFCGICRTEYIPSETHDIAMQNVNSKAATCYEAAFCGICNNTYGTPLEHDLLVHEKQHPDCTNVGYIEYVECQREGCGYTTKQEIPALGHLKVDVLESEPTCFEYGVKACNLCVYCEIDELIESMHHRDEYRNKSAYEANQHKWNCEICNKYWQYLKDPLGHDVDCTRSSYSIKWNCLQLGYCGDCKQEYGKIYNSHTEGKPETCTQGKYCSVCEQYYGEPLGHDVDCTRSQYSTKATCTQKGYCGVCKEYYLLDHEYKNGQCILCKKEESTTTE